MAVEIHVSYMPVHGSDSEKIEISASYTISATTARRKATGLAGDQIGNLLFGGEPNLVIGDRVVWRVPIMLAYADAGIVGQVGTIDIDANSAAPIVTEDQLNTIRDYAAYLAERTAHFAI